MSGALSLLDFMRQNKLCDTFLRNSMLERLSALAILSIERDFVLLIKNFNEKVVDKFAEDAHTETSLTYHFFPLLAGSLKFRVKAGNDATVALTSGPTEDFPMYEVIIGGWKNTKCALRRNRKSPDAASASTPSILSEKGSREFWIKWSEGNIRVGCAGNSTPFLMYWDPDPFPVSYYGVRTGWGAVGEWLIEGGRSIATENDLKYHFYPVPSGSIMFDVQCPSNANIALVSARDAAQYEKFSRIEVIVGGWENTQSAIRRDGAKRCIVTAATPGIVTKAEPKSFRLHWKNGSVHLDNGSKETVLEYHDPEHVGVTYIGIRTSYGATGDWSLTEGHKSDPGGQDTGVTGLEWKDAVDGNIPEGGFIGGNDEDNSLYIGRTSCGGALLPGKVVPRQKKCFVALNGTLESSATFQVLCGNNCKWVPVLGDKIPSNAIYGGHTEHGETLYIGRASCEGALIVGKVQQSSGLCYIRHLGEERTFNNFEVLVPNKAAVAE